MLWILSGLVLTAAPVLPAAHAQAPSEIQKEFFTAAGRGDVERVRELIAQGVDVNMDFGGMTAIMAARDPAMIALLAQAGADVNYRSDLLNMTVLESSVTKGKADLVRAVIQAGADVNRRDPKTGTTPLSSAARSGRVEIIKVLVEAGADVNGVGYLGMRPLSLAVMSGKSRVVQLLVDSGADVNAKDEDGSSPLTRAVSMKRTKIAETLAAAGGDVDAPEGGAGSAGEDRRDGRSAGEAAQSSGDEKPEEVPGEAGSEPAETAPKPVYGKPNPPGMYSLECELSGSPPPQGTEFSCSEVGQIADSGEEIAIFSSAFFEGKHSVPKKEGCQVDLGQVGSYVIRTTTVATSWDLVCRSRLGTTTGDATWIAYIEKKKPVIKETEKSLTIAQTSEKPDTSEKNPVSVRILKPGKGDQFVFTKGSPGKLTIDAEAEVKGDCDAQASWKMEEVGGSTQKIAPETASDSVKVTFEELPDSNSQFGRKKITASACGQSDSVVVELFFPHEASNHKGEGSGKTPNWFHYWKQTKAGRGYKPEHTPEKIATDGSRAIGQYDYTADKVFLTDRIMEKGCAARPKALGGRESTGIDCFAETVRHETQHQKERWEWWGATNPLALSFLERRGLDFDGDLVPDTVEEKLARKNCSKWDPTSCDGRPVDSLFDIEMEAYWIGWEWPVGSADPDDWSWCGKQWDDVSVCPGKRRW